MRGAVVPGRSVIGIELPNQRRETVYLRELLASQDFEKSKHRLPIALGKTIGGEPVIVDLARMPHLLVAGTTGSGKSVAINTMILSLLYRLKPEQCRRIMVDQRDHCAAHILQLQRLCLFLIHVLQFHTEVALRAPSCVPQQRVWILHQLHDRACLSSRARS